MKDIVTALWIFISLIDLASASDGSFDRKMEDSYQHIVIGAVSDVRVVALIGNLPATVDDVKKSSKDPDDAYAKRTLLYTGVLKVEKTIKGQLKPGKSLLVTWSQAGNASKDGYMRIKLSCPRVTQSVAEGSRRVFGVTGKSGSFRAWHIVDGPTSLYEPQPLDPNDPFSQESAEQGGTGEPATRPESDSEGGDKPQPESKGRTR